jgi:hypothetical protein
MAAWLSLLVLLPTAGRSVGTPPLKRPNLVLAFSDDTGWGDPSCFGNPAVLTPGLDTLAREGLRLTSFYVAAPICSSSRSSLLTGRIPLRTGVWSNASTHHITFPIDSTAGMDLRERTLAEVLRSAGYKTAALGKVRPGTSPLCLSKHAQGIEKLAPSVCLLLLSVRSGTLASCRSISRLREGSTPTSASHTATTRALVLTTSRRSSAIGHLACHHREMAYRAPC